MPEKVLLVDDEPQLLAGLRRNLQDEFEVFCAEGGLAGLKILEAEEDIAVVVSDYKMPGLNGVEFLQEAKKTRGDSVRMLLTGFADVGVLTDAINEGSIFRFLSKPCSVNHMRMAIRGGVRQFRLIRAEKELLDKTLMGCVQVFGELIGHFDPVLHGQVKMVREILHILPRYRVTDGLWEAEIAVLLSHLGWMTVPPHILEKVRDGEELSEGEKKVVEGVAQSTCRLLGNIPRLEAVIETIRSESDPCGVDAFYEPPRPWMILRACRELVNLRSRYPSFSEALEVMEKTVGIYHPECMLALRVGIGDISRIEQPKGEGFFRSAIKDLKVGMTVLEPVSTKEGLVIVPENHELNAADIERIRNFHQTFGLKEGVKSRF